MATISASVPGASTALPGRRYDNRFFSSMSILILVAVFIGFAPTYFFAGIVRAPLPNPIIHFHGAIFTSWVLLLAVQTSLVSARRLDIHRRLGVVGFCLAGAMVVAGFAAATNALVDHRSPGNLDPRTFYVVPLTDISVFAVLIFFAVRLRKNPAAHKRLILLATISLLTAAFARFHLSFLHNNIVRAMLATYALILLLAIYDYWSTRRVHHVTLLSAAWIIGVGFARLPLGHTSAWLHFAGFVQSHATWLK